MIEFIYMPLNKNAKVLFFPSAFPQVVSQVLKNPLMLRKIVSTPVELLEPL